MPTSRAAVMMMMVRFKEVKVKSEKLKVKSSIILLPVLKGRGWGKVRLGEGLF